MRKYLFALVAVPFATPALAGSLAEPVQEYTPVVVAPQAPVYDWTGFYGGLQLGTSVDGSLESGGASVDADADLYGVTLGYRKDFGGFVLGGGIDYMMGDGSIDVPGGGTSDFDVDHLARIGVKGGKSFGRTLVYGTLGYADTKLTDSANNSVSSDGYYYGVGMDYMVSEHFTIGGEVLKHKFDSFDDSLADANLDMVTVGLNLAYKF
ncbi:outer membrane protein [Albibacillus kandeliae]|uniref:outer membrane protein n=1 Tax=Albibacillus kandeliae TaxID=2174228 RepID=UPI000D6983CA|nr:outer membrane beta-barrel protein [Albibacillus kandeliae]